MGLVFERAARSGGPALGRIIDTEKSDARERVVAVLHTDGWIDPFGGVFSTSECEEFEDILAASEVTR